MIHHDLDLFYEISKGAFIKYVERGWGWGGGFYKLFKNIRNPRYHRPKYFMAQ